MFPFLFRLGDFGLHSYIFFLGTAFVVALFVTAPKFKNSPINQEKFLAHGFVSFFVSLVGARALFVLVKWELFEKGSYSVFRPWEGGIVFLGGLIAGFLYWGILFYRKKMPLLGSFSNMVEGLCWGHAIGRIGCFLNGCCFGTHCPFPLLSVTYTSPYSSAPTHSPLYPTQIFESLWLVILAIWIRYRQTNSNKYNYLHRGSPLVIYLVFYGLGRFLLEFLRGDFLRGFWGPLSTSQWLSLFLIFVGVYIFKIENSQNKNQSFLL